jgi:hypothetical protein
MFTDPSAPSPPAASSSPGRCRGDLWVLAHRRQHFGLLLFRAWRGRPHDLRPPHAAILKYRIRHSRPPGHISQGRRPAEWYKGARAGWVPEWFKGPVLKCAQTRPSSSPARRLTTYQWHNGTVARRMVQRTASKKQSRRGPKATASAQRRSTESTNRKPLTIRKLTLPVASLRSLPSEQRSAILLLGLFLNEANWLRKLLVKAAMGTVNDLEGQASFALTVQIATTLAAKIHEGWKQVRAGMLAKTIHAVALPDDLKALRKDINRELAKPTISTIRNSYAFHYPAALDFAKLASIDDTDSVIYATESTYNGDIFSHLSSLAALEPLLAIDAATDWQKALVAVWNDVTKVAGLYCFFLAELLTLLIREWLDGKFKTDKVVERDVPQLLDCPLRFFVHPPADLEEPRK